MTTATASTETRDATAELRAQAQAAAACGPAMAAASTAQKNEMLHGAASLLRERSDEIVQVNERDVRGAEGKISDAMIDRLRLTPARLAALADSVDELAFLPDPAGEVIEEREAGNGLRISRVRVPLGVIASIYESRPNVTVDIAGICLKAGNCVVLRGGREAAGSNAALAGIMREALARAGLPEDACQLVRNQDRALVGELLAMSDLIDLMVPRGGKALIERVRDQAAMPVVAGGVGICHTYVDAEADIGMALEIVHNAKTRRVSICNAMDVLLVHERAAGTLLPELARRWADAGVEIRADEGARRVLDGSPGAIQPAEAEDFDTEFLAMRAAVRMVPDAETALAHIAEHGSGHSEAIVTADAELAERFLREVDAAAVYVNASTQFTDGGEFGLGCEVGISTGKLHARGPMGLRELTSYKWVVRGDGQTRPL